MGWQDMMSGGQDEPSKVRMSELNKVEKSPLGIEPKLFHIKSRRNTIYKAMLALIGEGYTIPNKWLEELVELNTEIDWEGGFSKEKEPTQREPHKEVY